MRLFRSLRYGRLILTLTFLNHHDKYFRICCSRTSLVKIDQSLQNVLRVLTRLAVEARVGELQGWESSTERDREETLRVTAPEL